MTSCHPVCTYCYVKVLALLCPIAGHDRGYGSADVFGSDTRRQLPQVKKSLHIPLEQKGQLPRERRAVGAAKAGASLVFRAQTSKVGFLSRFSRGR